MFFTKTVRGSSSCSRRPPPQLLYHTSTRPGNPRSSVFCPSRSRELRYVSLLVSFTTCLIAFFCIVFSFHTANQNLSDGEGGDGSAHALPIPTKQSGYCGPLHLSHPLTRGRTSHLLLSQSLSSERREGWRKSKLLTCNPACQGGGGRPRNLNLANGISF